MSEKKAMMRTGKQTPVKQFETFPLADASNVEDRGDTRIPAVDDVRFVKEFVDENEK